MAVGRSDTEYFYHHRKGLWTVFLDTDVDPLARETEKKVGNYFPMFPHTDAFDFTVADYYGDILF